MKRAKPRSAPWHLWLIGGASLLFHSLAVFDYVATLTQGEDYMRASGMTDAQIAYFTSLPPLAILAWTVSVWAGLLGSLALLMRQWPAAGLFLLATAGTAGYVVWTVLLSSGVEAMGMIWFMPLLIGAATLALADYARRMAPFQSPISPPESGPA